MSEADTTPRFPILSLPTLNQYPDTQLSQSHARNQDSQIPILTRPLPFHILTISSRSLFSSEVPNSLSNHTLPHLLLLLLLLLLHHLLLHLLHIPFPSSPYPQPISHIPSPRKSYQTSAIINPDSSQNSLFPVSIPENNPYPASRANYGSLGRPAGCRRLESDCDASHAHNKSKCLNYF
jgi:hypothetical protein